MSDYAELEIVVDIIPNGNYRVFLGMPKYRIPKLESIRCSLYGESNNNCLRFISFGKSKSMIINGTNGAAYQTVNQIDLIATETSGKNWVMGVKTVCGAGCTSCLLYTSRCV